MAVEAPAIRERLLQYLNGELGREDFERWFLEQTWELDLRENPGLRGLCGEIELCLAELSNVTGPRKNCGGCFDLWHSGSSRHARGVAYSERSCRRHVNRITPIQSGAGGLSPGRSRAAGALEGKTSEPLSWGAACQKCVSLDSCAVPPMAGMAVLRWHELAGRRESAGEDVDGLLSAVSYRGPWVTTFDNQWNRKSG